MDTTQKMFEAAEEYGNISEEECHDKGIAYREGFGHGYWMLPWDGYKYPSADELDVPKKERKRMKKDIISNIRINYSFGYIQGQIKRPDHVVRLLAQVN